KVFMNARTVIKSVHPRKRTSAQCARKSRGVIRRPLLRGHLVEVWRATREFWPIGVCRGGCHRSLTASFRGTRARGRQRIVPHFHRAALVRAPVVAHSL